MFDGDAGERPGVGEQLLFGVGERVRRARRTMSSR